MTNMRVGDLCLVTGVSGFLASWISNELLERGFRVRGTVRSLADASRTRILKATLPGVELVAADLRSPEGWTEALRDCRWIFHVASPQASKSEKDRTGGAVAGTQYLMQAALESQLSAKVVLTSSEAAIAYGYPKSKQQFTEDDWTVLEGPVGRNDYFRSKTLSERLAWRLARDPVVNRRQVALATINPGFIAGPSLVPWARFSFDFLKNIAEGRVPFIPDLVTHLVDVRDCARMHIAVMNNDRANGHRHFSFATTGKLVEVAQAIRESYADIGIAPGTRVMPPALAWVLRFVSSDIASIYNKLGTPNHYVTRWPDVYQYVHTDLKAIVKSSMESMLERRWIEPPKRRATRNGGAA
jgi:nucleoside-diphosphate-sugar epimerase